MHPRSKDLSGLVLAAAGFGLLTGCDVVLKWLAADHSKYQLLAVNSLFAAIAILSYAALTGGVARLSTRRLGMHMVRATAGALSMLAGIYAYTRLSLTDFYAIIFAGPLLVTGLSAMGGDWRWVYGRLDCCQPFSNRGCAGRFRDFNRAMLRLCECFLLCVVGLDGATYARRRSQHEFFFLRAYADDYLRRVTLVPARYVRAEPWGYRGSGFVRHAERIWQPVFDGGLPPRACRFGRALSIHADSVGCYCQLYAVGSGAGIFLSPRRIDRGGQRACSAVSRDSAKELNI